LKKGRQRTLTEEQDDKLIKRIQSAQNTLSHLTNHIIVREAISVSGQINLGYIY